jgi:hypothetical protein
MGQFAPANAGFDVLINAGRIYNEDHGRSGKT